MGPDLPGTVTGWSCVAFAAGGVALIEDIWWLFWAAAAAVLLSVPVGRVLGTI